MMCDKGIMRVLEEEWRRVRVVGDIVIKYGVHAVVGGPSLPEHSGGGDATTSREAGTETENKHGSFHAWSMVA